MSNGKPRASPAEQAANSGDLRRRMLRHYLPIILAGTVALVVFVNVPYFDANDKSPVAQPDIFDEGISGAWPSGELFDPRSFDPSSGQPSPHGGGQPMTSTTQPSEDQSGTPATPHAGGPSMHGGEQGGEPTTQSSPGHTPGPTSPTDATQAGAQTGFEHAGDFDTVLRMRRLSFATGYIALGLLGITLLIGPINLLRRRRNPLNIYLRRDLGIMAAVGTVAHTVFGILVKHGDGTVLSYFFATGDRSRILTSSFGLANWAGLAGVLIAITLLVISSDAALRKLKARRWKTLQRFNYALFGLVVVHAVLYGALWRTTSPYTIMLGLMAVAVLAGQAIGVRLWRQRNRRATAPATA